MKNAPDNTPNSQPRVASAGTIVTNRNISPIDNLRANHKNAAGCVKIEITMYPIEAEKKPTIAPINNGQARIPNLPRIMIVMDSRATQK
jgi:hypothetical protein